MEFTKINDNTYLVPIDWADGIKCRMLGSGNEYTLNLPNSILRSIKVDIINNTNSVLSNWYESLKGRSIDMFIFIDSYNITLLKNLRRVDNEILCDDCINCIIDYKTDNLYRIEYQYGTMKFNKQYFIEESDFGIKYPKLINILKIDNEKPFNF